MSRSIRNKIKLLFTGALIVSIVCMNNQCCSQKPFLIGGQGKWINKGKPFSFNGAKISIFDSDCMDAYVNGMNLSLICSKIRGINGFSFAPYALSDKVTGFQFALINRVTTLKGLEIGILNQRTHFIRPSAKLGNYGLQLGVANATFMNFGMQLGLVNSSWSSDKGISIGAININSFFQFGLINIKNDNNKGIQIGILNYQENNKWYAKVLPITNFRIEKRDSF